MEVGRIGESGTERQKIVMNFRGSELTSGKLLPLHRPPTLVGMPERCSPARIRFAALTRVLACSAPFRQTTTCDGRLRREHLPDSAVISSRPEKCLQHRLSHGSNRPYVRYRANPRENGAVVRKFVRLLVIDQPPFRSAPHEWTGFT